jgi:hypothetical protein
LLSSRWFDDVDAGDNTRRRRTPGTGSRDRLRNNRAGQHDRHRAERLQLHRSNVSIQATLAGIWVAKQITVDDVDVTMTGDGVKSDCIEASQPGGKVVGTNLTVTGCEIGVTALAVDVANLTVTDSNYGVFSGGKLELTDSSVTGSMTLDLYSKKRPVLVNTTCDTSQGPARLGTHHHMGSVRERLRRIATRRPRRGRPRTRAGRT